MDNKATTESLLSVLRVLLNRGHEFDVQASEVKFIKKGRHDDTETEYYINIHNYIEEDTRLVLCFGRYDYRIERQGHKNIIVHDLAEFLEKLNTELDKWEPEWEQKMRRA